MSSRFTPYTERHTQKLTEYGAGPAGEGIGTAHDHGSEVTASDMGSAVTSYRKAVRNRSG